MVKNEKTTTTAILNRIIFVADRIPGDGGSSLIQKLVEYEQKEIAPILLCISSHGGDVGSALATIDWVQMLKSPVFSLATGRAYSSGALLLLGGSRRFITRNTRVLLHTVKGHAEGDMSALNNHYIERCSVQSRLEEYICERTGLSSKKVKKLMDNERFIDSKEAVELGFADEIIKNVGDLIS